MTGRTMVNRLVFAVIYLRNFYEFRCAHRIALAATRLEMALRQHPRHQQRRRGTP